MAAMLVGAIFASLAFICAKKMMNEGMHYLLVGFHASIGTAVVGSFLSLLELSQKAQSAGPLDTTTTVFTSQKVGLVLLLATSFWLG